MCTPQAQGKLGCAQHREVHAHQIQGKIGLHTPQAHVCIPSKKQNCGMWATKAEQANGLQQSCCSYSWGSGIFCLFIMYFLFIYRVAQVVVHNTGPHAPVEHVQPKAAVHMSVGCSPWSANWHQLLGCVQQTPERGLIDKGNDPLSGVQKWLPEVGQAGVWLLEFASTVTVGSNSTESQGTSMPALTEEFVLSALFKLLQVAP